MATSRNYGLTNRGDGCYSTATTSSSTRPMNYKDVAYGQLSAGSVDYVKNHGRGKSSNYFKQLVKYYKKAYPQLEGDMMVMNIEGMRIEEALHFIKDKVKEYNGQKIHSRD